MNFEADVCIVGAGPCGALLGYLLEKKGLSVMLLEQHEELGKAFRGEFLNEEGEAVLKSHDFFNVQTFQKMCQHDIEEVLMKQIEKEQTFAANFRESAS